MTIQDRTRRIATTIEDAARIALQASSDFAVSTRVALRAIARPPSVAPPIDLPDARLSATLHQHPVGQGLFHSGRIDRPGRPPFTYVYDCGKAGATRADWTRLVAPVVNAAQGNPLNALFVSHFDSDHVNGLGALLRRTGGADVVFLPYVHPSRRLLLGIREDARRAGGGPDFLDFLDDPAQWLLDRDVRRVVYVGGSPPDPDRLPRPPSEPDNWRSQEDLLYEPSEDPPDSMLGAEDESHRRIGRVTYMDHTDPIRLGQRGKGTEWVFQTYVDPDEDTRREILSVVRSVLGKSQAEYLAQGYSACSDILADDKLRSRLADAYHEAFTARGPFAWFDLPTEAAKKGRADRSEMNRGSMSVFSGPWIDERRQPSAVSHSYDGITEAPRRRAVGDGARHGWLLTGDAALRDRDVLREFVTFYGDKRGRAPDYLSRVAILSIPHHGSAANFNGEALDALEHPPVAVVPAGRKTHYGHPHDAVIALLARSGVGIAHAHEASGGFHHSLSVL